MEEEKLSERHNSLWAFLGTSHAYKCFFRKFSSRKSTNIFGNLGFTYVELIVVILILAVLIILSIAVLNPVSQIQKAKDAIRQNDLNQLYTALDTYYNDKGCYPTNPDLSELTASPIYIKKIPKDPDAPGVNYNYFFDPNLNNCPQWFTIITRAYKPSGSSSCPLKQLDTQTLPCVPKQYRESGYNLCKISGNIKCSDVSGFTLPVLSVSPTPIITPIPNTPTPTITPTPVICNPNYYAVTAGNCNLLFSGDSDNRCTIHGGPLVCYKAGSIGNSNECSGPKCDQ